MKPKTRLDNFLAKIAKDPEADTSMEPKSREEHYLNKIAENGGSGSGSGYTVTEERVTIIPEQTVAANEASVAPPGYSAYLEGVTVAENPETLIATFDGTEYSIEKKSVIGMDYYGATITMSKATASVDWEEYPFVIISAGSDSKLIVETESTHTIKAEAVAKTVTPSDDFKEAVAKAPGGYTVIEERTAFIPEQIVETEEVDGQYTAALTVFKYISTAPASIVVSFNGTDYWPEVTRGDGTKPTHYFNDVFAISLNVSITEATLVTRTAQTVTIKAESVTKTIVPSDDFKEAVAKASKPLLYDFTLVPDETQNGRYLINRIGSIPPYNFLSGIVNSYRQFFFNVLGRRIAVNVVDTTGSIQLSASYIEGNVLHKLKGGVASPRYTGAIYITETTYTLTPDA